MATTTENVIVNLKVNADGVTESTDAIEAQSKAIRTLNVDLGGLNVTFENTVKGFALFRTGSVALSATLLRGNKAFKAFTGSLFIAETTIAKRVLPALLRLLPVIGLITAAVLGAIVVFKSWSEASQFSLEAQERMAIATDKSARNWNSWISTLSVATDAIGEFTFKLNRGILTTIFLGTVLERKRDLAIAAAVTTRYLDAEVTAAGGEAAL